MKRITASEKIQTSAPVNSFAQASVEDLQNTARLKVSKRIHAYLTVIQHGYAASTLSALIAGQHLCERRRHNLSMLDAIRRNAER